MLKPAEDVLGDLVQRSNISLHSDSGLVSAVDRAAAKYDEKRAKKQADKDTKDEDTALRRKPELQAHTRPRRANRPADSVGRAACARPGHRAIKTRSRTRTR